ncbi:hypothetical protein GKC56_01295 [Neisseriaceae bacterium PsAf]|nr:hypothetical protein [Neisseriaceae bacterium PsAf]MCV2502706.1 hypothetical protein [Neisseriaceae bacterium]
MKFKIPVMFIITISIFSIAACSTLDKNNEQKKIYYTENDFLESEQLFKKIKEECRLQKRSNFSKTCQNVIKAMVKKYEEQSLEEI